MTGMRWTPMRPLALPVALIILAAALAGISSNLQAGTRSTAFWATVQGMEGLEAEHFETLEELYFDSDLVVLGTVSNVRPGRVFGEPEAAKGAWFPAGTLSIEKVLHSRSATQFDAVTIEFIAFDPSAADALLQASISDRGIFFLRNKGEEARRLGEPASRVAEENAFYRLTRSEAVILDDAGNALVSPATESQYLTALGEKSFDAVVETLVALRQPSG